MSTVFTTNSPEEPQESITAYPLVPIGTKVVLVDGTSGNVKLVRGYGSLATFEVSPEKEGMPLRIVDTSKIKAISDSHARAHVDDIKRLLAKKGIFAVTENC